MKIIRLPVAYDLNTCLADEKFNPSFSMLRRKFLELVERYDFPPDTPPIVFVYRLGSRLESSEAGKISSAVILVLIDRIKETLKMLLIRPTTSDGDDFSVVAIMNKNCNGLRLNLVDQVSPTS